MIRDPLEEARLMTIEAIALREAGALSRSAYLLASLSLRAGDSLPADLSR